MAPEPRRPPLVCPRLAVFGRSRRTLGRRPSVGACWLLRIVATGAKLQRRARLQRRAKAEWAELSWARPMESGWAAGGPAVPRSRCFCGTRSARREVRLCTWPRSAEGWPVGRRPSAGAGVRVACGARAAGACQVASLRNLLSMGGCHRAECRGLGPSAIDPRPVRCEWLAVRVAMADPLVGVNEG